MNSRLSKGERYIRLQKVNEGLPHFFLKIFFFLNFLFFTSYTFGQIKNNYIDYTNGLHGTICATSAENDIANLSAPAGTVFTTVDFASYGTPTGSCNSFAVNAFCHATGSQAMVEGYVLGNNTASIPATNAAFTDPCAGTTKRLYIQAKYTQPICNGTSPGTITGTTPTGGWWISYEWEKSTVGPSSGFSTIAGATSKNYTPGNLSQTTWFRRKVSAFLLSDDYSSVLQITIASQPSVSAVTTPTCIGGSTGTITATGSGGFGPYTFNLNSGAYQSSASFTGLASGTYTLRVKNSAGCTASSSVTISSYSNSTDNQSATATDSWIGHVYSGMNFNNYIGHFTEPEMFDEGFGGDYNCFNVISASTVSSIYTEQFSVRFRMNSTRKGLYIADLGSDDGSRLTVDGTLVYNNWSDQSFSNRNRVLMTLTGSSSLNYEFYENGVQNRLVFQNLTRVLSNELTSNTTQSICLGSMGSAISGDAFGTLPPGISLSGTGYQWSYSATPTGIKTNIAGATSATYTPNTLAAPFNAAGIYYIYRNAKLSSANNTGVNSYVATNVSNAATITVNAIPSATISYTGAPFCNTLSVAEPVTISGTPGGQFTATPSGLSINPSSGAIVPSGSLLGDYTITYRVVSAGCPAFTTSRNIYVGTPGTWTGHIDNDWSNTSNWICGLIPGLSTDVVLSKYAANYPIVINGSGAVKNITLEEDAFLMIKGTLKIAGNIINNDGAINAANGSIEMNGSSGQTISGRMFYKKVIKNLIVSNTGEGLSVSSAADDTLKISGTLSFGNSNSILNTGDNITLVSDSAGTANVGKLGGSNAINGKVIVERYINTGVATGQHAKSWQFLATPTNGQTIKESWMENGSLIATGYGTQVTGAGGTAAGFDLATASPSLKYYDPLANNWVGVANTNEPIYDPKGYMVFVRGNRGVTTYNQPANTTTLRTKGTLLTGNLLPISVIPGKMASIGNPYASPIDFTLIAKGTGVDNKFYVWDPYLYGSYGLGGYQTLSSINNWRPVPGGTVTYKTGVPYKTIQSGQAFFVHATPLGEGIPSDYTLTFTENCKAGSSSSLNFARQKDNSDNPKQFFRTSLYTGTDSNSMIADGNAVAFDRNFSNDIDGNDALKIAAGGENFDVKRNSKLLAVEARSLITENDTIHYNMSNLAAKTYQLRFAPVNMEQGGLEAFLLDKYLNTSTPVSLTDSSFVNISVTSNAASAETDRFKVVFRKMVVLPVTITSINAYEDEGNIVVKWKIENESSLQQYEIEKSADGISFVKAGTVAAKGQQAGEYKWLDENVVNGYNYYRIRSVDRDGKTSITQVVKVLIGLTVNASISVYPNPVTNGIINLQLKNEAGGMYHVRILNPLSQSIITKKINYRAGDNISETFKLGKNAVYGIYVVEVISPSNKKISIKVLN